MCDYDGIQGMDGNGVGRNVGASPYFPHDSEHILEYIATDIIYQMREAAFINAGYDYYSGCPEPTGCVQYIQVGTGPFTFLTQKRQ